ncbi:SGNH/GDSL hydrolase family protein [bacterium]|jgi:hypothetical protein|nr:SGNH/GDSL hydrolase family protein [bacterium]
MIRSILRTLSRFLMAIALFALVLCAAEVYLRWERIKQQPTTISDAASVEKLVLPSSTSWIEVSELVDFDMPVSLNETTRLRTTEFGTRGSRISVPKPESTFRVLCLGSSRLFGLGQKEEETITTQLQNLFQEAQLMHVEFVNAGCPGAGPMANYLRLRTKLISLQPNLILYCVSIDDLNHDSEIRGGLSLDQQGIPAYATHPASREQASDELSRLCEEFAVADWLTARVGPMIGLKESNSQSGQSTTEQPGSLSPLLDMQKFCAANHCQFMISIIPDAWEQKQKTGVDHSRNPVAFERGLHEFFAEHKIQSTSLVHNPSLLFQQNGQEQGLYEERTGNLNSTGNAMYARTIAKSMVDFFPSILQSPVGQQPPLLSPSPGESSRNETVPITRQPEPRESILR